MLGVVLCILLTASCALWPQQAWAKRGGDWSCAAMAVCQDQPVLAFSNWGAGPVGSVSDLIIATTSAPQPTNPGDWRFHVLRDGLRVYPNDECCEGQIVMFPTGTGIGLVSSYDCGSDRQQSQMFAAWSAGCPTAGQDWVVSPTGIKGQSDMGWVAGAGTGEYIAAALVPYFYATTAAASSSPGIYLAVAKLPLTGNYTDWRTACLQIMSAEGLPGAKLPGPVVGRPGLINLAANRDGLFLAGIVALYHTNARGDSVRHYELVIGRCASPLTDPSRWEYAVVDTDPIWCSEIGFTADETQLYLAYGKQQELWLAQCTGADALDPGAWRISQSTVDYTAPTLGLVHHAPAIADRELCESNSGSSAQFAAAMQFQTGLTWNSCPVPGLSEYISIGEIAGLPVLSSYSFAGKLNYIWARVPHPRTVADWHAMTVVSGQVEARPDHGAPPGASPFPPLPAPCPSDKLAAQAIPVPVVETRSPFSPLIALGALAGIMLALVLFALWLKRKRRQRA